MDAGANYGITPAGIWALDVARIEAGLIMLDVDYFSAHHALIDDQKSSPFELNLGWTVSLDKGPYNGRARSRRASARLGVGVRRHRGELGRRSRRSTPSADLPPQLPTVAWRASAPVYRGRKAGRLRDERLLVAAAQEVSRARAHPGAALRAGHAGRDRDHGRASAQAGGRASCASCRSSIRERKRA